MKRTIITLFSFLLAFTAMAAQDIMSMSVKGQWVWVTCTSQYVIGYNMETGEKRLYRFTDTALTPSYFTAVAEKDDGTLVVRHGIFVLFLLQKQRHLFFPVGNCDGERLPACPADGAYGRSLEKEVAGSCQPVH